MILGGSEKLLPIIEYSNKRNHYSIVCDYHEDNPGREISNEFHHVSTIDKDAILNLSGEKDIDGIISFSSDINAITASYVGEILGLPSNPFDSTRILAEKDAFRDFLKRNGFHCPRAKSFRSISDIDGFLKEINFPVVIKPIDSSGSSGVIKIDDISMLRKEFMTSMLQSKEKKVIIEEYIEMDHDCMIAGDAFVLDGEIQFFGLLNSHRHDESKPFIPTGTSYPVLLDAEQVKEVENTVQHICDLLQIRIGALNLELMYDKNGDLHVIEIAPRNGGNMIPELLNDIHGLNLIEILVDAFSGDDEINFQARNPTEFYSTYVLYSKKNGKLKNIEYRNGIDKHIYRTTMLFEIGDEVTEFNCAKDAIGFIFLHYKNLEEGRNAIKNINEYIQVIVE